jgi:hypothetical protein
MQITNLLNYGPFKLHPHLYNMTLDNVTHFSAIKLFKYVQFHPEYDYDPCLHDTLKPLFRHIVEVINVIKVTTPI